MTGAIAAATGSGDTEYIHVAILEVDAVGDLWIIDATLKHGVARYPIDKLKDGWNTMPDGEEIYYISNPALGLWAHPDRFKD